MITGFLQNNRMGLPTGCGNNVSGMFARWAWVPLKKGETELMMYEVAVSCIKTSVPFRFGLTKVNQRENESAPDTDTDTDTDLNQNVRVNGDARSSKQTKGSHVTSEV